MANISLDKLSEIIKNRPSGISDDAIIDSLKTRGHTLEGEDQSQGMNFLKRLGLSFGDTQAREKIKLLEKVRGTRGKLDIGDIADVAGGIPSLAGFVGGGALGSLAGPAGGIVGGAVGASAGETVRQTIGKTIGTREQFSPAEIATEGIAAGVAGGAAKVVGLAGKAFSSRFPKLLGIFSGESDDVIKAVLKNPVAADLGIKQGDAALRKIVQKGTENSVKLQNSFIQGHRIAFEKLAQSNAKKLVSKKELLSVFENKLRNQGVQISGKKLGERELSFTTSKIIANPGEVSKIKDAYKALQQWDDLTLAGTNDYKQLVGRLTRFADEAGIPSKSPFLGGLYREFDKIIKVKLPKKVASRYGSLNKKFTENIELFDDMVDTFNKGDPFTRIANLFGKNKDTLRQIIEFYEKKTGQKISGVVAGRELGLEKQAAFGFLNPRSWIDFFLPPSKQAKIVTFFGKRAQRKPILPKGVISKSAKTGLFELLRQIKD